MDLQDLHAFESDIRTQVPGFQVAWKDTSWLQKLIGWILFPFNSTYMVNFVTTFYPTVYFPTQFEYEESPLNSFIVLAHERVHLLDTKASPFWFRFSYLLPQILFATLFPAGLVSVFFSWWVGCILFALATLSVLPWPSPWRTYWEKRGYAMTLAATYWTTGSLPSDLGPFILTNFLGWFYYKMSWSQSDMDRWLKDTSLSALNGTLAKDPIYGDVLSFLRSRGLSKI